MTTPRRIQLSRAKGWRMPENTVKVDRSTPWGNPFYVGPGVSALDAVERFYAFVCTDSGDPEIGVPPYAARARSALRGKSLACWCALGQPCHADVLLELANAPEPADV